MQQKSPLNQGLSPLPRKIPADTDQLQRAITLLGNRTQADLQTKPRQELVELIGGYPSAEQAAVWKQSLRRMQKERAEKQ